MLAVVLVRDVRSLGGKLFRKGTVVYAKDAADGILEVAVGGDYLPLNADDWEPVVPAPEAFIAGMDDA